MYATNERTTGKLLIRDQIAATRLRGLRVNLLKIDAWFREFSNPSIETPFYAFPLS